MHDLKTVTFDAADKITVSADWIDQLEQIKCDLLLGPEPTIALAVKRIEAMLAAAPTPAAQSAGQEAVRYFVHDNEYGYNEFKTDAERDAAHKSAIEWYLDDGWSEEVNSVVSGIVTHKTVKCNVQQRPESCVEHPEHDGDNCDACDAWNEWPNHEFDYTCGYEPEALIAAPVNGSEFRKRVCAALMIPESLDDEAVITTVELTDYEFRRLFAESVNGGERAKPTPLFMTGWQLLEALDLVAPDRDTDRDQLDCEIALQMGGETCHSGAGLYAWEASEPEEGSSFLAGEREAGNIK
ncbi:hypothetical protein [Pandoraea pnomenusa]|uniref:hypothetical protein n=1 Tax=Pandoraea pnomenusa TaxID=93220 RepID=UPI0007BCBE63|nr:hypothetical protein [Pandoraea pnomenusa]ANC46290.1 hypothetical protein A6P55_21015 [Pandoraea pnomenusa]